MTRFRLLAAFCVLFIATAFPLSASQSRSVRVQVVDQSGLPVRDAVVELHLPGGRTNGVSFPWRMAMAQKDQAFVPGTLIVAKGSTVAFPNLDRVRHSIYSFSRPAKFEIELYGRDQTRTQHFPLTGSVRLGCNIHDDMRGYIRVTDTPFAAKTDSRGFVELSGVPAGSAKVTVWHPRLRAPGNEITKSMAIAPGGSSERLKVELR